MPEADQFTRMSLDQLQEKAREIRRNVLDMVYTVQSGHIGGSFSEAEILAALYYRVLRIRPEEPKWEDRDRFILSKGHACPGLYAVLAMRGFFPTATLATLREFGSPLQGHPVIKCPGIDMTTGSLGIGFGIAAGIALEAWKSGKTYDVYTVLGDGELNEGIIWEVAGTANKYRLGNLVAIVDRNTVQNDGPCDAIMPTEPIDRKFESFLLLEKLEQFRIGELQAFCIADTGPTEAHQILADCRLRYSGQFRNVPQSQPALVGEPKQFS